MTSYHNDQCRSRNKPESLSWTLPPLLSLILFLDPDVLKAKTKILHQVQMQSLKKAARLKKGIVKMRFYPLEKVTLTLVDNKAPR